MSHFRSAAEGSPWEDHELLPGLHFVSPECELLPGRHVPRIIEMLAGPYGRTCPLRILDDGSNGEMLLEVLRRVTVQTRECCAYASVCKRWRDLTIEAQERIDPSGLNSHNPEAMGQLGRLSSFRGLRALPLDFTQLDDEVLAALGHLSGVNSLMMSSYHCTATGKAVSRLLQGMDRLCELKLKNFDLGHKIYLPDCFRRLSLLEELNLTGIGGAVPPSMFQLSSLRDLFMSGNALIRCNLPESMSRLTKLHTCHLTWPVERLPLNFGSLRSLSFLSIRSDRLVTLPKTFTDLENLEALNFICRSLERLPEVMGRLTKLSSLMLSGGLQLTSLPSWLFNERWSPLRSLRVQNAGVSLDTGGHASPPLKVLSLSAIPNPQPFEDICIFRNLRSLSIRECHWIRHLPMGHWAQCLKELLIAGCHHLEEIPDSIGSVRNLVIVSLENCTLLQKLPETLGLLGKLEHLSLISLPRLHKLPDSLSQLPCLRDMHLQALPALEGVPDVLPANLEKLHVGDVNINSLPGSWGEHGRLQHLDLKNLPKLTTFPESFARLPRLKCVVTDCALDESARYPFSVRFK